MLAYLITQQPARGPWGMDDLSSMLLWLTGYFLLGGLAAFFHYFPLKRRGGDRLAGFIFAVPIAIFLTGLMCDIAYANENTLSGDSFPFASWVRETPSQVIQRWTVPAEILVIGLVAGGLLGTLAFRPRKDRLAPKSP